MTPSQAAQCGAEGAEGMGLLERYVLSPKKIVADLSLKEAIRKHFKMTFALFF